MTDMRPAHILVVDDDDRIRDLLTKFLRARGLRVTAARDGAKALSLLAQMRFDLIILDVMMPGADGFEVTETVRRSDATPILLLTARGEPEDRIKGLSLGADDYLAKPFEPEELVLRVQAILRRALPQMRGPSAVAFGPWRFEIEAGQLSQDGASVRLTGGETALLAALARSNGEAVSRQALSEQAANGAGERAVDVQITRLRRKIETDPKSPLYIQTVRGSGYKLVADPVYDVAEP
ncbi:response regulator transcription factor [Oceanicaulis alexandrii]|uniref:response regulator n=1 Tax=Oceanicaulis alexandrii TaxID=153233 RepID=UPI0035CF4DEC